MTRLATTLTVIAIACAGPAVAGPRKTKAATQAEIWTLEQAIYAARGRGDMTPYIDHVAGDYLAWPPRIAKPGGIDSLRALAARMTADNQEVLTMAPIDFSLNGDTAVIYYTTHRTRLPGGGVTDERFDVLHTWVREKDKWRLLGGMARLQSGG